MRRYVYCHVNLKYGMAKTDANWFSAMTGDKESKITHNVHTIYVYFCYTNNFIVNLSIIALALAFISISIQKLLLWLIEWQLKAITIIITRGENDWEIEQEEAEALKRQRRQKQRYSTVQSSLALRLLPHATFIFVIGDSFDANFTEFFLIVWFFFFFFFGTPNWNRNATRSVQSRNETPPSPVRKLSGNASLD